MKYGRSKKSEIVHKIVTGSYYRGPHKACGGNYINTNFWIIWSDGARKSFAENDPWNFAGQSDEAKSFYVLAKNKKFPIPPGYILEGLPCTRCFPERAETIQKDCPTCGTLKTWKRPKPQQAVSMLVADQQEEVDE